MNPLRLALVTSLVWLTTLSLSAQERAYRTDRDSDDSLPWHQLVDGQFPPPESAHYISGELIQVDHVERRFVLRVDRTDKQNRSHFDLPLAASMLPYGAIHYHGSWASLEDIPLGTHLHGQFYRKDPRDKSSPLEGWHGRVTPEADFNRCFLLEDDFSFHARQGQLWKIEAVDREAMKLTAAPVQGDRPAGDPRTFDLLDSTRVWRGRCVETLDALAPGQKIQLNITWATLYGPGRVLEIWLDEAARQFARDAQLRKHHLHVRLRGLPGWVEAVDNRRRIVTVTLFGNVDPALFDELPAVWDEPTASREADASELQVALAVARPSLVTYDPVNDRKRGPLLEKRTVPIQPGSGGLQIQVQPDLLLEGFRPTRIVRVYPATWPVIALPKEEQWFGREEIPPLP